MDYNAAIICLFIIMGLLFIACITVGSILLCQLTKRRRSHKSKQYNFQWNSSGKSSKQIDGIESDSADSHGDVIITEETTVVETRKRSSCSDPTPNETPVVVITNEISTTNETVDDAITSNDGNKFSSEGNSEQDSSDNKNDSREADDSRLNTEDISTQRGRSVTDLNQTQSTSPQSPNSGSFLNYVHNDKRILKKCLKEEKLNTMESNYKPPLPPTEEKKSKEQKTQDCLAKQIAMEPIYIDMHGAKKSGKGKKADGKKVRNVISESDGGGNELLGSNLARKRRSMTFSGVSNNVFNRQSGTYCTMAELRELRGEASLNV